ncbi:MAG: exonuclease domain-containing protein [archaeon]|jgi:DNA polymerase III epsilon subunit-like protein
MIIVDTEASGVDTNQDSLLSIGALDFDNPTNQFYGECHIWDGAHINKDALAVNGFTEEQARDPKKQTDGELAKAFMDWAIKCKEHTFAGQNPSFDRDFIHSSALKIHLDWPFAYRTIDQHSLCYMHMTKRGITPPVLNNRTDLNSDTIMQYVGIPAEPHPHNALNGAKVAAEAISRLLYDKKLLPEFERYDIPWIS